MCENLDDTQRKTKVLIVDDEVNTCKVLKRAFGLLGYYAESAQSGSQALAMLSSACYDVILLDLKMPGIDGVEVMQYALQKYPDILVIILTAYATINSAIAAVKAGAVDYLLKPQTITEIQMAVEKALKRRQDQMRRRQVMGQVAEFIQAIPSEVDPASHQSGVIVTQAMENQKNSAALNLEKRQFLLNNELSKHGLSVDLTANEAALLALMMRSPERVFSNRDLAVAALGYINISETEAKAIIRPHITRLRKKIEIDLTKPTLIRTVRGRGYLFSLD